MKNTEIQFLDTIDVLDYLELAFMGNFEVEEVMDEIKNREDSNFQKFTKDETSHLFTFLDKFEFTDYVEKRYKDKIKVKRKIETKITFDFK